MQATVFREYDIRGEVGAEFVLDEVYPLAQAIATFWLRRNPGLKTVVLAMDGRVHSPFIAQQISYALCDSGLQVLFLGVCPTPVMYFSLHKLPVDAGIMVTASHNGPVCNGLKINLGLESVWGQDLKEIKKLYEAGACVEAARVGECITYPMIDRYVAWLAEHFAHLKGIQQNVIIDCANGATGAVLPLLVEKMQWPEVSLLYEDVDGNFPHHQADPVVEKNMVDLRRVVSSQGAILGIGFDGDGDRMAPLTHSGQLVYGDQLLLLYAQHILKNDEQALVVYDIKCSQIVPHTLQQHAIVTPSGHAIVKSMLRRHKASLAGELSCHFFFADRYFGYDDGIYAALRLLELLETAGKSLQALVDELPKTFATPEIRMRCAEDKKEEIVAHVQKYFAARPVQELVLLDGVKACMSYGWGLVRASNTQPVICLRCESDTVEGLAKIKRDFFDALEPCVGGDFLKKEMGF